ncbi:MAG: acylphosphatase [Candidatus Micrarchaeia archaeon]
MTAFAQSHLVGVMVAFVYRVYGFVQGVGYRAYVKRVADACGVDGYARNLPDGSVEIVAKGSEESIARFETGIKVSAPGGPEVHAIEKSNASAASIKEGFVVL